MIVVVALAAVAVMSGAAAGPAHDAEISPSNLSQNLYQALNQVTINTPLNERDLASVALTCKEAGDLVRYGLIKCHVRRLFYPEHGVKHFEKSLRRLSWETSDDSLEIQLLKQLGTESNQVLLARKLVCMMWTSGDHLKTAGETVRFLFEHCGYGSLPGHILGICMETGSSMDICLDFLNVYIIPLAFQSSLQSETFLPSPIHDLFLQHQGQINLIGQMTTNFKLLKIIPEPLHHYVDYDYRAIRSKLLETPYREILRGRPDLVRALFRVGFCLDLYDIVSWKDLSVTELRGMVPYLRMRGFDIYLAVMMGRGQHDLVAELLRHLPVVCDLQRFTAHYTLFLACLVAIRLGAGQVLRGLLHIPMTIDWLGRVDLENAHKPDADNSDAGRLLLHTLRGNFRPGSDPVTSSADIDQILKDRETLFKALKEERSPLKPTLLWNDSWIDAFNSD